MQCAICKRLVACSGTFTSDMKFCQCKREPVFIEGWMTDMAEAGWRTDPVTGKVYNINDTKEA